MPKPSPFVAAFADGQSDTLVLSLVAGDSMTCRLSNVHGGVTVTNEEWDLEATADDGLSEYFESLLPTVNLGNLIPSPIGSAGALLCTYTLYLDDLAANAATFEMVRTDEGLTLRKVYSNITADLRAPSPGVLCPDITGNIAISSIVVETRIAIGQGENPQITLGETNATINGLQVNVDGAFGFVVEIVLGWFRDSFTSTLEEAIASPISSYLGYDLSGLVIMNTGCAE